jgi:hypothetical protein
MQQIMEPALGHKLMLELLAAHRDHGIEA